MTQRTLLTKTDLAEQEKIKERIRQWAKVGDERYWGLGDEYNAWLKVFQSEIPEVKAARMDTLTRFVEEELGVEEISVPILKTYGLVAKVWGPHERVAGASYSVHRELIAPENRDLIQPGMTIKQAVEARRLRGRKNLEQAIQGEILPVRKADDPYAPENEDRETNRIEVPAGPSAADVKYERIRLVRRFKESVEALHEVEENLQRVLGVLVKEDQTLGPWPNEEVLGGKVGWLALVENAEQYLATIRALIDSPMSMDEGLAAILGGSE